MRIVCCALIFVLLMSGIVQAQSKNIWNTHPEWFTCQEDDQCALFCETCGNVSVNKGSADHAKEVRPSCLASIPCLPEAVAQCLNNQCVSVIPDKKQ